MVRDKYIWLVVAKYQMILISFFVFTVPLPQIDFTSTLPPVEGQPYQSDCSGTVPDSLSGSVNTSWIDSNGDLVASQQGLGSATAALSFNLLQLSDAGTYTCVVTVSSPLVSRTFVNSTTFDLAVEGMV